VRRLFVVALLLLAAAPAERRPNILLVITDDQGYGDLGLYGNKDIKTPNLDRLGRQSCRIDPFCVSPVCSPTRSSLLTGRYTYRTGIVDTFMGRSMMHTDEVTIAEMLGQAGYRTGIFGKWHLGDNYPLRPQDQGFQECLTIRGGGIGQPSDPPGGDHYQDPTMYRNGAAFKSKGYCTDVFTDGAMKFIEANAEKPFFAYVAYNAPHTPLEAPEGYVQPYLDAGLPEPTAKLYAMVTNIDDNVGRLLKKLDDLKLADDTIVIFMSDNGPEKERYNAALRGLKGTVYEGGLRVPFFIRWPTGLKENRKVAATFAHIDVTPTLLEMAGVAAPADVRMDGISFLPWLREERPAPERTLFFQWHRGDVPQRMRSATARGPRYKAVWTFPTVAPQLFDLETDPGEKTNIAADHLDVVHQLSQAYGQWFADMERTRHFAPPRIILGVPQEDPAVLTRQDWRGENASWTPTGNGHWLVTVPHETKFDVTLRFRAPRAKTSVTYKGGTKPVEVQVEADATSVVLPAVPHAQGDAEISATIAADKPYGPNYVELKQSR
jgi:arylsulfatase A-like enzyme